MGGIFDSIKSQVLTIPYQISNFCTYAIISIQITTGRNGATQHIYRRAFLGFHLVWFWFGFGSGFGFFFSFFFLSFSIIYKTYPSPAAKVRGLSLKAENSRLKIRFRFEQN